jgi:ATP-binding cassette, subfamily B, bacterial
MRLSADTAPPIDSETSHKAPLSALRYLLDYLRPYRWMVVGALLALVITSSSVLGIGYALRYLVDEGIGKRNLDFLNQSYFLLMGVIILLAFTTFARYYLVTIIGEKVVANIRNDIYRHLISLDITFYETNRIGELLSRLTTDTTLIQTVVGSSVSIALRNTLLLIGGLTMLCVTSLQLTGYVLLIVPLVVIPIIVLGKRVRRLSRATQDRVADVNAHAEETLNAIHTVQAFTLEQEQIRRFGQCIADSLSTATARIRVRAMLTALVITLVLGAIATVLWVGGKQVIAGDISVGELSSFVFYAMVVAGATGAISEVLGELQRAAGAVERLAELKAEQPRIISPQMPVELVHFPIGRIVFDHVTFRYPARPDIAALDEVSFVVEQGQTVAIVGPSGSGKTTIFRLLLRYYDPTEGRVTLEDIPIDQLDLPALRTHIAIVAQDPVIFSASAYDNIALGLPNATPEAIRAAAQQAEILEFLESLPEGMHSFLGEKGIRLSGGQKQRIAIARALLRAPDILLLDEATSALDSENERKVQDALNYVMQHRTTLVIAHRLATVRNADNIILMNHGRIDAIGTHDELMERSTLYQTLAKQQFRH